MNDFYEEDIDMEKMYNGHHNINLYLETIRILAIHGLGEKDILWIGNEKERLDFPNKSLKEFFDFYYYNGYGGININDELYVVGKNWWLERHEYDGSEWWEFKTMLKKPDKIGDPDKIIGAVSWWKEE